MGRPKKTAAPIPSAPEETVSNSADFAGTEPTPVTLPPATADGFEPMPEIIESSVRVMFEGQHVVAVLYDGHELRDSAGKITHYHCSLDDGTTKHVPVTAFK